MVRAGVKHYLRPADVGAAYGLLEEHGPAARLVGGGTDLAIHPPLGLTTLIDVSRLPLAYIDEREEGIAIGATTTLTDIQTSPALAGFASGVLPGMLAELGAPVLRNVATLGGHLARGRLSDLIPVLLTLDAEVRFFDGAAQTMPLADFFEHSVYRRRLVVTEVLLPAASAAFQAAFVRFSRAAFDFPVLNCAVAVELGAGVVEHARVVVGETPRLGRRVHQVEAQLVGKPLTAAEIEVAARSAKEVVAVGDDQRASADYRSQLVYVGVRRALSAAVGQPEPAP